MSKINKIPDFENMSRKLKADLVTFASDTGLNHFQDSFYNQGFTDVAFEPWQGRANGIDPSRSILVGPGTGYLLKSVQVFSKSQKRIVFGSDAEYAEIHNNGGTIVISITEKSRRYFWYMYKVTGKTMWKAMALTKKQKITIKIPQRQFIGESWYLLKKIDDWVINTIQKRFKKL